MKNENTMKHITKRTVKPAGKRKSYHELHWAERSLDIALVAGVLIGFCLLAVELFAPPQLNLKWLIISVDTALIGIFVADSGRTFFRSRNLVQYVKNHWIDMVILIVVLLSLSSVVLIGIGRLRWLLMEERVVGGTGRFLSVAYIRRMFK